MAEIISAFCWCDCTGDAAECAPERIDGPMGFVTQLGLQVSSDTKVYELRRHVDLRVRSASVAILLFDREDHSLAPTEIKPGTARRCGP